MSNVSFVLDRVSHRPGGQGHGRAQEEAVKAERQVKEERLRPQPGHQDGGRPGQKQIY